MSMRFGAYAKLYTGSNWVSPVWTEIRNVNGSLEVKPTYKEADSTTRGSGGVETTEPTLLGIELSWTMLEDPADPGFLAMRQAFFLRNVIQFLTCSAAYTVAGEPYIRSDMKITGFEKSEPLDG